MTKGVELQTERGTGIVILEENIKIRSRLLMVLGVAVI